MVKARSNGTIEFSSNTGKDTEVFKASAYTWLIVRHVLLDNFCDFLFPFMNTGPMWKEVYSKRKTFAPYGSKFFPFRVDLISEVVPPMIVCQFT